MPHDLPKAYDPNAIEERWAEYWVKENLFAQPAPSANAQKECPDGQSPFTILLPPPNVTGRLHMGHMLNQTEMDILSRWRRMSGRKALWVPGTDHAGIATQMMVERQLASEGKKRQDLGREAFVERVWEWKRHYGGAILGQMKRLGASVDWSREYFTMDEHLSEAVRHAFVTLHEQGLVYRGAYIVNWCPRCQTAISDLECVHEEQKGHLWEIRYPVVDDAGQDTGEFLTVATTRPETMLGDSAVAIHPADERYLHLHGKKLRLPLVNRLIPIILDEWVSLDFGTGAVKVTPAHDPNDFALGERHNLESINIMDDTGHINAAGGPYAGLERYEARKKVLEDLTEQGLAGEIKDHTNNVGHCDRCKTVVEPRLSNQWFVAVNKKIESRGASMAELAIAAVNEEEIKFTPEMYKKTYLNWMENIHDWCISRQLWWGHRIPAWHCADCRKITVAKVDPTHCAHCNSEKITQETDVLDTWFSSGLLPVSIFGWPNVDAGNRADFDAFYPTSLLVTGFDILFFWVARMIMMGCWFAKDVPMADGSERTLADSVPFREVYIHGLIRDANREKMSKTKGNVVDPIETIQHFGTDAVRFTLASMASPGADIAFNVDRTDGYRAFANKIWNAARFIFMNVDKAAEAGIQVDLAKLGAMPQVDATAPLEARWIVSELNATAAKVSASLENYRFDDAASSIYQFFWGQFCDWYLEIVKLRLDFEGDKAGASAALNTLVQVFEASLRLLSPFMPFLTEEIWHAVYDGKTPLKSIALTEYPSSSMNAQDWRTELEMGPVQLLMSEIRGLRKEIGVPEKEFKSVKVDVEHYATAEELLIIKREGLTQKDFMASVDASGLKAIITANADVICHLTKTSELIFSPEPLEGMNIRVCPDFGIQIEFERQIDVPAERERLTKEIAKLEKGMQAANSKLGNEGFMAKAPAHIVEGLRKQAAETQLLLDKATEALAALPNE